MPRSKPEKPARQGRLASGTLVPGLSWQDTRPLACELNVTLLGLGSEGSR